MRFTVEKMCKVFNVTKSSYGSIRITEELNAKGRIIGKNKVAKMMQAANLYAIRRKKFKVTTDSKHNYPVAPNLLNQEFSVTRPGEVWVSDISYGVPGSRQLTNCCDTSSFEIYYYSICALL